MDIRKVKKLIEMLENSNLEEIEIQEGEESVRLVKSHGVTPATAQSFILPQEASVQASEDSNQEDEEIVKEGNLINSPMVGTFYRAAAPGEDPFVDLGSKINIGQTICILEAMKLMNEIESEFNAEIVEILVENGTPVEFGQVLMRVKQS